MKNMKKVADSLKDDLRFAEKIEDAWKTYDKGLFIKKTRSQFIKELRAC